MSQSNPPEASGSNSNAVPDEKAQPSAPNPYFFVDEGVVFLIENKLYRIPRSILLQSEFFRDMLESPLLGDQEGVSEEKPITPGGIAREEIECLLDLLYARALDGIPTFNLEQLCATLHLATKWGFDKAREHAIKEIDKISQPPLDRLELAFRCAVPKWLRPAYEQLCTRSNALTMEEATRLGMRKFFAISQIREKRHPQGCTYSTSSSGSSYCYSCGRGYDSYSTNQICVNVGAELERLRDELDLGLKYRSLQSPSDQTPWQESLGWTPFALATLSKLPKLAIPQIPISSPVCSSTRPQKVEQLPRKVTAKRGKKGK